jgi:transcriptional regulator with XRE-family HTH domain
VRKTRKLSIEDLATNAGLHWTTVSRIENHRQIPRLETLAKLANALDWEMSDLARLAAKQPKTVPEPS